MILNTEKQSFVKQKLASLNKDISIDLYLTTKFLPAEIFSRNLLEELIDIKPNIHLNLHHLDTFCKSPILVINRNIEFWGTIQGYIASALIDTLEMISWEKKEPNPFSSDDTQHILLETFVDPFKDITKLIINESNKMAINSDGKLISRIVSFNKSGCLKSLKPTILPFQLVNEDSASLSPGIIKHERLIALIKTFSTKKNYDKLVIDNDNLLEIDEHDHLKLLYNKKKSIVFSYTHWSGWSRFCHQIFTRNIDKFNHKEIALASLNAENHKNIAYRLGICTIPTMIFIEEGKIKERLSGRELFNYLLSIDDLPCGKNKTHPSR
ncbi:MAG: thioredoxin family protein [Candidatus Coatesbacteria bacterium]|nr:thioredoxin family protein [Candidatus Coatesbacteria bacterium]